MKKIAVLGANGQLGKTLQYLAKNTINTYTFYTKDYIDVTNKKSIESIFNTLNFDFCVNCSAYTNVEAAETYIDEAFAINAEGVKNIAEVCEANKTKLIHISTDYVFDGEKKEPYLANDKTNPINVYGASKLKGEFYIQETLKEHYIIRTSWLYSPYGKNFVKSIINKIDKDLMLNITTEEKGTPTSCIDLSEFIFHLIDKESIPFGIFNFSAQGSTSWYGFAKEIAKQYDSNKEKNILPTDYFKTLANRPKYSVLDNSKTEEIYKRLAKWEKSVQVIVTDLKC
ncbi:dTDP-4-dehydrorhamnose reductase [Winogradskyella sp. PE311]|uniref:dTDP-4-dehydrorhamnose reductase n=1 Tax=Winogradskyella sp. PE311 TaxID=3366943 RepID=UPI00397FBFF1